MDVTPATPNGPGRHRGPLGDRLAREPRMLPEDARRSNRGLILRALHHGGPASRADLAKLIGLTPATVSAVIKELLEAGLVDELGRTSGAIGKPATMVGIEPDARHIVTVSLSEPDQFVGALVNLAGKVVLRRTYERNDRTGAEALALLGTICDDLVEDAERPLLGVGVATPGIVDPQGTVLRAARLGWSRVPVAHELAARTGLGVYVANDANASALAELTFGVAHSSHFLMVRVDQGVGVGLVLDGALYRGSRSASGEIGHVVVDPDGSICTCGKRGCLESEITAPLLGRRLNAADGDGEGEIEILRRAGERLGTALATVLSALDIGDVILSGPEPVATETFRQATIDAVAARTMPELSDELTLRASSFGDDDVVLGAAALVLDEELDIR
jgi:predicted NBD/HSP70 family sugar kinase